MTDPLQILRAVDRGARLWIGNQARDVSAGARKAFRREVARPGADPAAAAARVLDRVMQQAKPAGAKGD